MIGFGNIDFPLATLICLFDCMVENNLTYGDLVYIRSLLDTSRQLGIFIVNQDLLDRLDDLRERQRLFELGGVGRG